MAWSRLFFTPKRDCFRPVLYSVVIMYQSNRVLNIPPGIPWVFDAFSCLRGRAFDHHSWVGGGGQNLITSLDFLLRVMLIPRGLINRGRDSRDKL